MAVPSKAWTKLYQAVACEMGMPPRGPQGCEANIRRQALAPAVLRETNRRWKLRRHPKKSAVSAPARPG